MIAWLATIHFDKILAGIVGLVALWLSIETLRDIHKTKELIKQGKLKRCEKTVDDGDNIDGTLVIDNCYLTANSSPYVKVSTLRYN